MNEIKKYLAKGLTLGIVISNLPLYSFASNIENKYYNELSNIEIKEDLQRSAQKAVVEGEVDVWIESLAVMPESLSGANAVAIDKKIYCISSTAIAIYDTTKDVWDTSKTPISERRSGVTVNVVNNKIYVIGGTLFDGSLSNKVEVYDPTTDIWETKTSMSKARYGLTSVVIDNKIYCIGGATSRNGYLNTIEVYDTLTDEWTTITDSQFVSADDSASVVIDGKIYVIGGHYGSTYYTNYSNDIVMYNPETNIFERKTKLPASYGGLTGSAIGNKIYCTSGTSYQNSYTNNLYIYDCETDSWSNGATMPSSHTSANSVVIDNKIYVVGGSRNAMLMYIPKLPTLEDIAEKSIVNAEFTKELNDIKISRDLVNQLPEGESKNLLQNRLDAIIPNISLIPINGTSNVDIYITTENILSMTLNTNTITFDDFSGIEDMDKINAINITVSSSLPYQLNAYLPVEIKNADKSKTMDKSILNIKENGELEYKTFTNINKNIVLKDNCVAGDNISHGVDLKLKGGIAHEKDVYKATIKLEVAQK